MKTKRPRKPVALLSLLGLVALVGCSSPTGSNGSGGGGEPPDDGESTITVGFPEVENPEIVFSGTREEVVKPDLLIVEAEGSYTGHVWYLDGSSTHAGILADGASATIDTSHINYGTHTVSLLVAEGYSSRFSFAVVDTLSE